MKCWKILVVLAAAVAVVLWKAVPAGAFNPQPEPPGRYMISLMPEDGIRVSLLYVPLVTWDPPTCQGSVEFRALETGRLQTQVPFSLTAGRGTVVTFTPPSTDGAAVMGVIPTPFRVELRASPQYCATASFELFDVPRNRTRAVVKY